MNKALSRCREPLTDVDEEKEIGRGLEPDENNEFATAPMIQTNAYLLKSLGQIAVSRIGTVMPFKNMEPFID